MLDKFGERLKAARKMAGLSLDALAKKAGSIVSKQALGKYETGQIKPSSGVLIALCEALGVKAEYFFRMSEVSITGIEFRKRSKLGKTEENRIKYRTIDFLQRYIEIEEILEARHSFDNPVSDKRISDLRDIENAARQIREKWNLGNMPIPHLIEMLEDKGFKIFEVEADPRFDGLSGFVENANIPVIAISENSDLVRKRFTVAHEVGHLLLSFSDASEKPAEKSCHAFAGALLLPKEMMTEYFGKRRDKITEWELKKLKGISGASMLAIMARAKDLEIISENTYRQFVIYASKHGWRKNEPGKYEGKEKANRFEQLVRHAAAEQIISSGKAAELLNISLDEFGRKLRIVS